ncbi:hypothetical protein PCANC_17049, partial [Puccinia coronata f. sp. avenae]
SSASHSPAFLTSNKMTSAHNLDIPGGDHSINAPDRAGEHLGQSYQVMQASHLPGHLCAKTIPFSDASVGSPSPSQDSFSYRTIGPAVVLASYQPKNSSVGSSSTGRTTPDKSPQEFEKLLLHPYLYPSDSIYPESSMARPDILDTADNDPTMSLLDIGRELLDDLTQAPQIPAGPIREHTLLDSAILEPNVYGADRGHNQLSNSGYTDSLEEPSPPPVYRPQSIETLTAGPNAPASPAHPPRDIDALAPVPEGSEPAIPDIPTDFKDSSDSQPGLTSELHANSTSEVDASLTLPTHMITLAQVDVVRRSLLEIQDDLISFGNVDALNEKHLRKDSLQVAPEGEYTPPSELSLTDTLNEPASNKPVVANPERSYAPPASSAEAVPINLIDESVGARETNSAMDVVTDVATQVENQVALESHMTSASPLESIVEACLVEHPHAAPNDQSPVNALEPERTPIDLNTGNPVESTDIVCQSPTSGNQDANVTEEFLIVTGLNPEQSPVSRNQSTPGKNFSVTHDDLPTIHVDTTQGDEDLVENSLVSLAQPSFNLTAAVCFPTSRPAEGNLNNWSLNPMTRMSSSTEIVDPLLRPNMLSGSVQDRTSLTAVVESPGLTPDKIKGSESGSPKHTLRARSISGFFKSMNKKNLAKADSAHSPSVNSMQSSDEDNRTLPKRRSFGLLKRRSGPMRVNRIHEEPVPPLPKPHDSQVIKEPKIEQASHSDDKLKVAESVESDNRNTPPPVSPRNQDLASERSFLDAASPPSKAESKTSNSPRKFRVSLAKKYFRSESAQPAPTSSLPDILEGPFSSVIGGIGYSPSAPRPNTLRKKRAVSANMPSPVLKDLRFAGLFSRFLGRKSHSDEIYPGA